tara:strand:- start:1412 stop:2560 length:1149 start_codon:yes stop_codon:yes gene_type:complete
MKNFYPKQYENDSFFKINHNYLSEQFIESEYILEKINEVVKRNDFTLGRTVDEVEELIANEANTKYAIGVGSGTDALMLSLKALGIGQGDEVITTTYTFYATIGAIVTSGARPIFCDCGDDFNIDPNKIEEKITKKTKAIMPVHWSGRPCDMSTIKKIAKSYSLLIVEDACHALQSEYKGERCGGLGELGCFSFHPLKNLNVWGDGGIITTNEKDLAERLKLIRNHGLIGRDTCIEFSYNSRLDTIQAVVAKYLIENKLENITSSRIANAKNYDQKLSEIDQINLTKRFDYLKEVFHLYQFTAEDRDELANYLKSKGVDAKVHYPIPMHLQPASKEFGYKRGDFPNAEKLSNKSISLPVHEFITDNQIEYTTNLINDFYKKL